MIKAAFFDVDGTLLSKSTNHLIPPSTKAALAELRRRGVKCVLCTGRPPIQLPPCIAEGFPGFEGGFDAYFVDHAAGVYPQAASGTPWNAASMAVKGDPMADLVEDLAAEQKARVTYDNILRLSDDPDVSDVIKFLRAREIVHFQRFGEAKRTR